jgi:hypothetical protein
VRRAVLAAGLVVIFAFSWLFRFNDPNGSFAQLTDDHFFYLVRGWQILFGDLPVRDFVDHGAPLYYYVAAAVQWLGGRGTQSEIIFSVTMISLGAALTFWLAQRASGSLLLGAAAALLQILLAPRFYNYPKILVYAAAVPAIWAWIDRPTWRRLALIALITAIGFLFRHDHGAFVGIAMAVALVGATALPWHRRLSHAVVYAGLVGALLAPYLLFIQTHGGVGAYFRIASAWAARDRARAPLVFPGLFDNPDGVSDAAQTGGAVGRAIATVADNGVAWMFYAELALPLVVLGVLLLIGRQWRPQWPHGRLKIAMVAVLGLALDAGFLRSPLEARLADPSVAHALLLAWLCAVAAAVLWRPAAVLRPSMASRGRLAGLPIVASAGAFVLVFTMALSMNFYDRFDAATMLDGPWTAVRRAAYMNGVLARSWPLERLATPEDDGPLRLAFYLRACTKPTDRVFMQHYLPQVLALAERPFAGGHADLRPGFFATPEEQRLTVARLQRQSVPVAMLETGDSLAAFRESFPVVAAYLDEHYVLAGERDVDGRFVVRLLVSRAAVPTRTYAPLDWPCFV